MKKTENLLLTPESMLESMDDLIATPSTSFLCDATYKLSHDTKGNVPHGTNDKSMRTGFLKAEHATPPKTFPKANFHENTIDGNAFPFDETYKMSEIYKRNCYFSTKEQFEETYEKSISNPEKFWENIAKKELIFMEPFTKTFEGTFSSCKWFVGGKLNACYNCVDYWAEKTPNSIAVMYEADNTKYRKMYTFLELKTNVCKMANYLKSMGITKGTPVVTYMPMIPQHLYVILACARIGAVHCIVFAGYSSISLAERMKNLECEYLVTADEGLRGGKVIKLKQIADDAMTIYTKIRKRIIFKNTGVSCNIDENFDVFCNDEYLNMSEICECEPMDSEDKLFVLYTSGSTGKPKGLLHTTAGYLLYAKITTKYSFNVKPGDRFGCVADLGWITGHSYVMYGPLSNGAGTLIFESIPTYPTKERYWDMIKYFSINQFYTAPTALRTLMKLYNNNDNVCPTNPFNDQKLKTNSTDIYKYELHKTVKVLGSVGEPINPNVWRWFYNEIGSQKCAIADTYWQTETGGHVITPLPGCTIMKPGSATYPFFGIDIGIFDPIDGKEILKPQEKGALCIKRPWPGMARTIYGAHDIYEKTYFSSFPSKYFTGDAACRDKDGCIWILGRVDDTLNVSGHRIGSAEVESALNKHPLVAESAAVGVEHHIKGQCICCFVVINEEKNISFNEFKSDVIIFMKKALGAICAPDYVYIVPGLPKTRSGKIVRRLLRKIVYGQTSAESLGDISTVQDMSIVDQLISSITPYYNL